MQKAQDEKSIKQKQQTFAYQAEKTKAEERPRTPMPTTAEQELPIPKIRIKRSKSS